jgi:hypothetical protein
MKFVNGWLKKAPPPDPYHTDNDVVSSIAIVSVYAAAIATGANVSPPEPPFFTVPSSVQSSTPTIPVGNP